MADYKKFAQEVGFNKSKLFNEGEGFTVFYGVAFQEERYFKSEIEALKFQYYNELNS